jgi:hypothetical protein
MHASRCNRRAALEAAKAPENARGRGPFTRLASQRVAEAYGRGRESADLEPSPPLEKNREIGVVVTDSAVIDRIRTQVGKDWVAGVAP